MGMRFNNSFTIFKLEFFENCTQSQPPAAKSKLS